MKECKWKNNPTEYNLNALYQQRRHVANIENRTNLKEIFTITNKLLDRNGPSPLPPSEDPARLAQEFSDFFHDKISSIMLQLKPTSDCPINNRYIEDGFLTQYHMHEFHEVREEEVLKLLITSQPNPVNLILSHQNFL